MTLEAQRLETERVNAAFNVLLSRFKAAQGRGGKRVVLYPHMNDSIGREKFSRVNAAELVDGNIIKLFDDTFAIVTSNRTGDRTFKTDFLLLKMAAERGEFMPARHTDYVRTVKVKKIIDIDTLKLGGSMEIDPEGSYERWGSLVTN